MDERRVGERRKDRHWFERAMLLVLVVLYVIGFGNIHEAEQATKREVVARTSQNAHLIRVIQKQRRDSILIACREVNTRNARSFQFLKHLPVDPNQPKRTPQETNRLIHGFTDALVGPVRNCSARARRFAR